MNEMAGIKKSEVMCRFSRLRGHPPHHITPVAVAIAVAVTVPVNVVAIKTEKKTKEPETEKKKYIQKNRGFFLSYSCCSVGLLFIFFVFCSIIISRW